jgi:hypothetical protein
MAAELTVRCDFAPSRLKFKRIVILTVRVIEKGALSPGIGE